MFNAVLGSERKASVGIAYRGFTFARSVEEYFCKNPLKEIWAKGSVPKQVII